MAALLPGEGKYAEKHVDAPPKPEYADAYMTAPHTRGKPDAMLERQIAGKFEDIADNGWFPEELPDDHAQLRLLRDLLPQSGPLVVLDAGCARGRFARALAPACARLYGVDLTETFVHAAGRNVPQAAFSTASLSALPFPSDTFDVVYCIEVLEHLPDTDLALAELTRVLKTGGTLAIMDKSLQGLNPATGIPNFILKPWAERTGKWMYPPDFAFRERWFWPQQLAARLRNFCSNVEVRFIVDGHGKASHLYRLIPALCQDVAWIGIK